MFGDMRSRAGICSDRPRGNAGRRGVVGLSPSALSSFDFLFSGSLNFGEGDNVGGPPSERERAFEGDSEDPCLRGDPLLSPMPLPPASGSGQSVSFNWFRSIVSDNSIYRLESRELRTRLRVIRALVSGSVIRCFHGFRVNFSDVGRL